jgi:fructan beta-fructosidase
MKAEHQWLNFPLSDTATAHLVEILRDGKPERYFMAQLAPGKPAFWSSLDVGSWKGSTLEIRVADDATADLLGSIDETDRSKELGPDLYREALRPQFHFSARRGWLNDPNGLVFCDGQYHLFFQHNPFTWINASKHWGHAVSSDLVHWHEVAEALYPTEAGQMYSGSAVVDRANSSGLVGGSTTPLVLAYTNAGHGSSQCLASTLDGVTFEKFSGNPVIPFMAGSPGSRDPRAFWYEPGHHWVLLLYVTVPEPVQPGQPPARQSRNTISIYTSTNLRDWTQTDSVAGGAGRKDNFLAECPDLFPLPVPGHPGEVKWLLQGASGEYYLGKFDGEKFTPESPRQRNHYGNDFYAAQTFNDAPDGRRVQIGWMRAPSPGMPFNQCLSIPLDLSLRNTPQGLQLAYTPVPELNQLHGPAITIPAGPLGPQANPLAAVHGDSFDLEVEIKPGAAQTITFDFHGLQVAYDVAQGVIQVENVTAPLPLDHGVLRLRMLLDRTTLDILGAHGTVYLPIAFLPHASNDSLSLTATGGHAEIVSLKLYQMKNSWLPVSPH